MVDLVTISSDALMVLELGTYDLLKIVIGQVEEYRMSHVQITKDLVRMLKNYHTMHETAQLVPDTLEAVIPALEQMLKDHEVYKQYLEATCEEVARA
jgi:hypothetical protein